MASLTFIDFNFSESKSKFLRCKENLEFTWSGRGAVKTLKWVCKNQHMRRWDSSEIITTRQSTPIYLNDLLLTSCVAVTGNNWLKCKMLFDSMNLCVPLRTTFFRNQNLFVSPEIQKMWEKMRFDVHSVLGDYTGIHLLGDGRSDSPGHCAKYCTYVLMENVLKIIFDMEILDCRETEGVSTRMEKEGLMRLIKKLTHIDLSELTTDASSSVIKAIRELADSNPSFAKLLHTLDTWHKSKALRKALSAAAKVKENEGLDVWVDSIVNHFWHCSKNCNQDLNQMKVNISAELIM